MNEKHLTLLALLNDIKRSDVEEVGVKLERFDGEKLEWMLDEALAGMLGTRPDWQKDPILRVIVKEIVDGTRLSQYHKLLEDYRARGVRIFTFWDEDYPERLRRVSKPPLVLYIRGTVFPGISPVAIVGTRRASDKGLQLAHDYARYFGGKGRTVVSGLAKGIDAAAHRGALDGAGTTIAVLAGDVDSIYPKAHIALAAAISERGALVSEVSPWVKMFPLRFVERNRITSGLSRVVIIVESRKKGGTMQQAKFALAQGRRMYVLDHGRFEHPEAREAFQVLKTHGAIPVSSPERVETFETRDLDQPWKVAEP